MVNQITTQINAILQPVVLTIVTVLGGYITKQAIKLLPAIIKYIITKIGAANYAHLRTIGQDVWGIIEEDKRLNQLSTSKIDAFSILIKQKCPLITDEEINFVRQAIAGEYNKDKTAVGTTVEAIDKAANITKEVVVKPNVIYKAPDGTLLVPKDTTVNIDGTAQATDQQDPNLLQ